MPVDMAVEFGAQHAKMWRSCLRETRPRCSASLYWICQVISACPLALLGNFAGQRLQFFLREAGEARDLIHGQLP